MPREWIFWPQMLGSLSKAFLWVNAPSQLLSVALLNAAASQRVSPTRPLPSKLRLLRPKPSPASLRRFDHSDQGPCRHFQMHNFAPFHLFPQSTRLLWKLLFGSFYFFPLIFIQIKAIRKIENAGFREIKGRTR